MANDSVRGAKELMEKLARLVTRVPDAFGVALYQVALQEMNEAKKRTPIDTGALKASGEVQRPEWNGREVSVVLQFGGPTVDYAVHVHENLEAIHPHGQAKFLESVLLESAPYIPARVAARIDLDAMTA